jgi:hypothetical protein
MLLLVFLALHLTPPALAQNQQCRTAPVGTLSANCASEAFVTHSVAAGGDVHGPNSAVAGHIATFADTTGKLIQDGGAAGTVSQVNTGGLATGGPITSTGTVTVTAATKSNQQTGTSTTTVVTPAQQQQHDSAAKAWVMFTGSASNGNQTINAGYNVTSVARTAAGLYTITFTASFASSSYACSIASNGGTTDGAGEFITQAAGSIVGVFKTFAAGAQFDPVNGAYVICFGRQ